MKGSTHLALGTTTGILIGIQISRSIGDINGISSAVLTTAACMTGSIFPDIDIETSKIGHTFKPVSIIINKYCGHRGKNQYGNYVGGPFQGLFHSPFLYLITGLFLYLLYYMTSSVQIFGIATGFTLGTLLHLLQDMFTKGGIPLFYPLLKKNIHVLPIKTGNVLEIFISAGIFIVFTIILRIING